MLRRLYDWLLQASQSRHAPALLGGISFAESSVFPIPPDVVLAPMVATQPSYAWRFASLCTIASVLGAVVGYVIGYWLFAQWGQQIIDFYDFQNAYDRFQELYADIGLWVVVFAAISFVPFKLATIASGAMGMPMMGFVLASLLGRGLRFFAVASVLRVFGAPILRIMERWFNWVMGLGAIILLIVLWWWG